MTMRSVLFSWARGVYIFMNSHQNQFNHIFSQDKLDALFPPERTIQFFEALFGDNDEGAYDIRLAFKFVSENQLHFDFELHQRPGRCLSGQAV